MNKSYDVAVIGAGLGGMTIANKLAVNGSSVLLIEQHNRLGGLASWFKRGNHIFDISLHGFPIGMKDSLRIHWNQQISNDVIRLNRIKFDNPQFSFETAYDEEDVRRILHKKFKVSKVTIHKFFNTMQSIKSAKDSKLLTGELLNNLFTNNKNAIRFLLEPITYANGLTFQDPAYVFCIVFLNFMRGGVYTFRGGSDRMLDLMEKELKRRKVKILTSALVNKIMVSENSVGGIEVDHKFIKVKTVISNANLLSTIYNLIGKKNFSKKYMKQANKVRLSISNCQVYFGFKKNVTMPNGADLIFASSDKRFNPSLLSSTNSTSKCLSVYYPRTRPNNRDCTVVSTSPARFENWSKLTKEQYKAKKVKLIKSTLNAVSKYLPNPEEKIDCIEVATPMTFLRYTLHNQGASFGTKYEGLEISMNMPKEIKGLFHVGSTGIISSGWLGAINYAALVSYSVDKFLRNN